MTSELSILCGTAFAIGLLHTLLGPDHYVPFVAMARAGRWTLNRTLAITVLCGLAHVLSSVVIGAIGIILGIAVFKLENVESLRGALAGWLLLAFGLAYFVWGLRRAYRQKPHIHWHTHADGTVHKHVHTHAGDHVHVHQDARASTTTPWILFTIFIFGPCEPLIPLLMYPAAQTNWWSVALVTAIFGLTTIATMTSAVMLGYYGTSYFHFPRLERYSHALAGFALAACGLAIKLGL